MCLVPERLREQVMQRLTTAAEEIWELLEKTLTEYEEEAERHRLFLEQLLQPRVNIQKIKPQSQTPRVKEELDPDFISDLKTEEPSWDTSPPQTLPVVSCVLGSWAPILAPTETEEEIQTEDELQANYQPEEEQLTLAQAEEKPPRDRSPAASSQTQPVVTSVFGSRAPILAPTETLEELQANSQTKEELLSKEPSQTEDKTLRFHCSLCSKHFKSKTRLVSHLSVHTGLNFYGDSKGTRKKAEGNICVFCSKTFATRHTLKEHVRLHTGEKPFQCSVCGETFSRKGSLVIHLSIHVSSTAATEPVGGSTEPVGGSTEPVGGSTGPVVNNTGPVGGSTGPVGNNTGPVGGSTGPVGGSAGPVGGRAVPLNSNHRENSKLSRRTTLNGHCECPKCGKRLRKTQVGRHLKLHSGEKPFQCPVCEKRFTRSDGLKTHMIIHSEATPFVCPVCGVSKRRKLDLQWHMSKHHCPAAADRSTCPVCQKDFIRLGRHLLTHRRESRHTHT